MINRFGIKACFALVSGIVLSLSVCSTFGDSLTFTIDSSQSSFTGSGTFGGAAITQQGPVPGSLVTRFSGSVNVDFDNKLNPTTINITGLSLNALVNGQWAPLPGGAAGTADADMAGQTTNGTFVGNVALRNLVVSGLTPSALPLVSGHFTSSNLQFTVTSAALDYNGLAFGSIPTNGSSSLSSYTTNNIAGPGSLSSTNNTVTLTIPITFQVRKTIASVPLILTCSGALVATAPLGTNQTVASFSGSPTNGTAPLAVTFTDNSTGTISNRFWNFGDGSTTNFAVSTNPVHTYNAGTYAVTLIVIGSVGSSTNIQSGYIVATNPPPPVASFSGSPTNGTAPLAVAFTDNSTGAITNRFWSFGDGSTTNTTLNSLGHLYNTAGTNPVSLTVFGPGGSSTTNRIHYIIVTSTNAAPDTTPPLLTVLSPVNYQTFTNAAITVAGTASDASGIRSVTVNGAAASGSTNWSAAFTLVSGTNTITVIATDNSANMNTTSQVVHAILNPVIPTNHPPQIIAGLSVTNALLQIGTIAVVVADDTNTFTVSATDADGDLLNYQWVFGDSASTNTTIGTVEHVYTTNDCVAYHASVTVSDGHASTNSDLTVVVACPMQITKLQGNLNFAKTNADSCTVKGTLDLPASFSFAGRSATLDVGGAQVSFTLDSKGSGRNGLSLFNKPTYNKKTGLWTFNATLKNGSWQSFWAAHGMVNATIPKPGNLVNLPVILVIDTEAFMATPQLHYTATAGKSGAAK